MTIATHVCRSNFRGTWFSSGGYDPVAPYPFQLNYDGFFLEYDTDRAGGFTLAEAAEHHHTVVLGLITSKDGKLEGENAVIERIHEVEQHLPLEQLHLPTQCGFSSTEGAMSSPKKISGTNSLWSAVSQRRFEVPNVRTIV